ncbi:MAG: hypothetical protein OEM03_00005, partial [Chromatiales bacterium]|nr:hypothetical protein [Chromatiales bacterium]
FALKKPAVFSRLYLSVESMGNSGNLLLEGNPGPDANAHNAVDLFLDLKKIHGRHVSSLPRPDQ